MDNAQKGVFAGLPQKKLNAALLRQMGAMLAWGFSWRIVGNGIESGWLPSGLATTAALAVVVALGLLFVYATFCFLRECDDFQRKIHLNALSLAGGLGFLGATTLMLFHATGLPTLASIGIGSLVAFMFVTYILCASVGYWRAS